MGGDVKTTKVSKTAYGVIGVLGTKDRVVQDRKGHQG